MRSLRKNRANLYSRTPLLGTVMLVSRQLLAVLLLTGKLVSPPRARATDTDTQNVPCDGDTRHY